MTRLLSANFLRLWRSKTFWASMSVSLGMGLFMVVDSWRSAQASGGAWSSSVDAELFKYAAFIGILAAEFISLFLGTEYSDGAIRNKIAVGHSRVSIYLANLITGFAASLMCMAGYMLSCLAVGAPLLGWFTKPAPLLLCAIAGSVLMLAAFCAIFTFVAMNCAKKSSSVVICLLGVFALLLAAVYLNGRLDAPEFITGYELSVNGEIVDAVPEPNPNYLTGAKREVYQFLYDLLPTGQSLQYTMLNFSDPARLMGLALAVCTAFTAAGAALFKRKDLK